MGQLTPDTITLNKGFFFMVAPSPIIDNPYLCTSTFSRDLLLST
jgi:capsule polysaccharide modification protein KpsS